MARAVVTARDHEGRCPERPATGQLCPDLGQDPDKLRPGRDADRDHDVWNVRVNTIADP
jgi:hypothetical protein